MIRGANQNLQVLSSQQQAKGQKVGYVEIIIILKNRKSGKLN
jgi:hypothetical protein